MTRALHYFKATNPDEVRQAQDDYVEERKAFFERAEEFAKELTDGKGELVIVGDGWRMWAENLVDAETQRTDPELIPEGWHFYKTDRKVRPYRGGRTKVCKQAVEAMNELNRTSPGDARKFLAKRFELPTDWLTRGFGVTPVADDIFLTYRDSQLGKFEWSGNEHFEPVRASAFHLAVELEAEREEAS